MIRAEQAYDAPMGRMDRARRRVIAAVIVVAIVTAAAAGALLGDRQSPVVRGVVVDPGGVPILRASVSSGRESAVTDGAGRFRIAAGRGWVTVHAAGWLPRTRATAPGHRLVVRLAPDQPGTVSFAFGGDVMFGRRFFDPKEDGSNRGLLGLDANVEDHHALLNGIRPLLEDADMTVVNLETPLTDNPYPDPRNPRPATFHPTKDFVFSSRPAAARALAQAGIDVVGIANNHLVDRLDAGVSSTRAALLRAGYRPGHGFFGAGRSPQQAWQPAARTVDGQRVILLGCTSITGDEQVISFVAEPGKGGAARCEADELRRKVTAAAAHADFVVVMIHGGYEYERAPSRRIQALSDVAVEAGATLVINHHPHVVGGLRFKVGRLTAWTLGNLLFDQTVWPTFESYLLRIAVRDRKVVSAWIEPVRIQRFQPTGIFGEDADWVARGALARSEGPWVVDDGSLWLDTAAKAQVKRRTKNSDGPATVRTGCSRSSGRDLLWTGDFEDRDLDSAGGVPLWNVTKGDQDRAAISAAAYRGARGVRLRRSGAARDDMLLTPRHRILVQPGKDLTLLLRHRVVTGPANATLQLSWYNDTKGPSQERSLVRLPRAKAWRAIRIDVRVPKNAVAVQPFVRLAPPNLSLAIIDIDDVRLIGWSEPGCGYVRGRSVIAQRALPPLSATPLIEPVNVVPTPLDAPHDLPPGPEAPGE
jgi:hypothetical protein